MIYRILANEFLPDALTLEQTSLFCAELVEHGIDAISVSRIGWYGDRGTTLTRCNRARSTMPWPSAIWHIPGRSDQAIWRSPGPRHPDRDPVVDASRSLRPGRRAPA